MPDNNGTIKEDNDLLIKVVEGHFNENVKFSKKIKKKLLKKISTELKRLDREYKENRSILDSYNSLIVDSVYYMIDRDNLTTSVLTGIHDSRVDAIVHDLTELGLVSVGKKSNCYKLYSTQIKDSNCKRQQDLRITNQEVRKCSNTIVSALNVYSNHINSRLNMILEQRKTFQKLYEMVEKL